MAALAKSSSATELMRLLLLALLTSATGGSVCDTAICGRGNCTELAGPIPGVPTYKCHCDPGWSQAWDAIPFSPCIVPKCSFDGACFNQSRMPPKGGGLPTDVCFAVRCGDGGACKKGDLPFSYSCECQPGYANLLNLTALPCVKNCLFGEGCSALGLGSAPSSQPSPPLSPPPTGDHDSSGTSAPTSGTKGSFPSQRLLQLLLLVTLAMAQVM